MKVYSFEKLEVWKNSIALSKEVYVITKSFPDDEKFGLISQVRRAVVSVSCNIVEGTSRWTNKEKSRFIEIAFGSLMEVINCLILAVELGYLSEESIRGLREKIDIIAIQLNGLKKSYMNRQDDI